MKFYSIITISYMFLAAGATGGWAAGKTPPSLSCEVKNRDGSSDTFWVEYQAGKISRFQYGKTVPSPMEGFAYAVGGSRDSRELEWQDQGNTATVTHFVGLGGRPGKVVLETLPREVKARFFNIDRGYYFGPGVSVAAEAVLDTGNGRCQFKHSAPTAGDKKS